MTDYKIIKEEKLIHDEQKLKFMGDGEWLHEADHRLIEYRGYTATIVRKFVREPCQEEFFFGGYFCGYVTLPQNHPSRESLSDTITCHGGITFNESVDGHHVIGFDCSHSCDIVPTMRRSGTLDRVWDELGKYRHILRKPVYRTLEFCTKQCMHIIDQLIDIENEPREDHEQMVYDRSSGRLPFS